MTSMNHQCIFLVALLAFVTSTSTGCRSSAPEGPVHRPGLVAPLTLPQDPLETIARYEDARRDGDGLLQALLLRGDEATRARAATALGRLPREEHGASVTTTLLGALDDPAPRVRAAAAFALGQRADPQSAAGLLAHGLDPDANVRARLVEAASRIDDPRCRARVVASLDDADPLVRAEAAVGPARFPASAPDARAVDERLVAFVERASADDRAPSDAAARRGALFALARRKAEAARALFTARLSSTDAHERIYAAQGLSALPTSDESARALVRGLRDADWRVACEAALALGKQPHPEAVAGLTDAVVHPSAHVRRVAFEALGSYADQGGAIWALLERARVDPSANVRAAALVTHAKLVADADAAAFALSLSLAIADKDAVIRAGAAAAAAELPVEHAVPMLDRLSRDAHPRVAGVAIEALGAFRTPAAHERLLELLRSDDNGLRLAAVVSLAKAPDPRDAEALLACMNTSRGEIAAEIAANVVELAPQLKAAGKPLVVAGAAHPDEYVRRRARAIASKSYPDAPLPAVDLDSSRIAAVPIPGKDAPLWKKNPRVEMRTTRGVLVFELFPEEAPSHVFNFLALIELSHYDGLDFHRVVPDFVVQGGDHRGDGNGGITWRGEPLRAEFTPRKFVRGSLGMPRNDDPDSGGSQFFVTHRETPHLDGRYTIFGELRSGHDVLDALEVGDKIVSVRLSTAP